MGFVTRVKTSSLTVGSTSIAPISEKGLHNKIRLDNRSSNTDARRSTESHRGGLGPVIDESAWLRSLQRRKVVEELIASEESYIADLKVLINDYFMILTALPALPGHTKLSIKQNITQILQLHEDLLEEFQQAVPQADFTKTQTSYQVARVNTKPRGMRRFFTYEEYGAHWTTMSSDLTTMCKGLHGWQEYERGVEALQKVITSENNRESGSKKALSFADLLIKVIGIFPVPTVY
ncbi:hypothetical protein N0V95_005898 [Ascochyta clinopodiicola]|nr:hypothetical protein N0V95_005898 [Ascochyta clinopodiicola]